MPLDVAVEKGDWLFSHHLAAGYDLQTGDLIAEIAEK